MKTTRKYTYSREQLLTLLEFWRIQDTKGNRDAKGMLAAIDTELAKLK